MAKTRQIGPEAPSRPPITTTALLKYDFTHDELFQKGQELARYSQERANLENEKKAIVSEYKAKLDAKQAQIEMIGAHINNGFEFRNTECKVYFDTPEPGMKTTIRTDNGMVISEEPMTAEERQTEITFP